MLIWRSLKAIHSNFEEVVLGGHVKIGGRCRQGRSVDRVTEGAETKACHRSMLIPERNAVLGAQIDQRRACSWPLIKSFKLQKMKISKRGRVFF